VIVFKPSDLKRGFGVTGRMDEGMDRVDEE
jgi:hypothetical protein